MIKQNDEDNHPEEQIEPKTKRQRQRSSTMFNVSTFLVKVFEMLSKPGMQEIISWTDDGFAFMIKDQTKFSEEILPIYFKHNNFSSFIRQLNMYDFHKSKRKGCPHMIFQHPQFKKDRYNELHLIKRKSNSSHPLRIQQTLHAKLLNNQFPGNLMGVNALQNSLDMLANPGLALPIDTQKALLMGQNLDISHHYKKLLEQAYPASVERYNPDENGAQFDVATLRQMNQQNAIFNHLNRMLQTEQMVCSTNSMPPFLNEQQEYQEFLQYQQLMRDLKGKSPQLSSIFSLQNPAITQDIQESLSQVPQQKPIPILQKEPSLALGVTQQQNFNEYKEMLQARLKFQNSRANTPSVSDRQIQEPQLGYKRTFQESTLNAPITQQNPSQKCSVELKAPNFSQTAIPVNQNTQQILPIQPTLLEKTKPILREQFLGDSLPTDDNDMGKFFNHFVSLGKCKDQKFKDIINTNIQSQSINPPSVSAPKVEHQQHNISKDSNCEIIRMPSHIQREQTPAWKDHLSVQLTIKQKIDNQIKKQELQKIKDIYNTLQKQNQEQNTSMTVYASKPFQVGNIPEIKNTQQRSIIDDMINSSRLASKKQP